MKDNPPGEKSMNRYFATGLLVFAAVSTGWSDEAAAPAAAPAAAATPAPTPAPALPVGELVDQLMKAKPEELKAKFDQLKAEAAKMGEDSKALRAQADALDAKAADLLKRIQIMEQLLGVAPKPAADAAPENKEKMTAAAAPVPAPAAEMKPEAPAAPAPAAAPAKMEATAAAPKEHKVSYEKDIKPIVMGKCAKCHNASQAKGGLALDKYDALMTGGGSGVVITPGDAKGSRLFRLVNFDEEPKMPMGGAKLDDATLELIKAWIEEGAPKDKDSKVEVKASANVAMAAPVAAPVADAGAPPMPQGLPPAQLTALSGPLAIRAIAASPTAPLLAVAGLKQILLYQAETQAMLGALDFPEGTAESLRFSSNGTLLIAAGGEGGKMGLAAVYDVVSGRRVADYGTTFDTVLTADITLDHKQVALGGSNKTVEVFATDTGNSAYKITTHTDWITAAAFSPDGWFLATADRAGGLYVWLAETGRDAFTLRGHEGPINSIDFRADSKVLASASDDGTIRLWELNNGTEIKKVGHGSPVLSVAFARDGRFLSSGTDGTAKLWNADGGGPVGFPALGDWAYSAVLTLGDSRVVAGSWLGDVKVWQVDGAKEVGLLKLDPPKKDATVVAAAAK